MRVYHLATVVMADLANHDDLEINPSPDGAWKGRGWEPAFSEAVSLKIRRVRKPTDPGPACKV